MVVAATLRAPVRAFADNSNPPAVTTRFSVTRSLPFGQSVKVVGSSAKLGAWDAAAGLELSWRDGDVWEGAAALSPDEIEIKFVVTDTAQTYVAWADGDNVRLAVPAGAAEVRVEAVWAAAGAPEVAVSATAAAARAAAPAPAAKPAPAPVAAVTHEAKMAQAAAVADFLGDAPAAAKAAAAPAPAPAKAAAAPRKRAAAAPKKRAAAPPAPRA